MKTIAGKIMVTPILKSDQVIDPELGRQKKVTLAPGVDILISTDYDDARREGINCAEVIAVPEGLSAPTKAQLKYHYGEPYPYGIEVMPGDIIYFNHLVVDNAKAMGMNFKGKDMNSDLVPEKEYWLAEYLPVNGLFCYVRAGVMSMVGYNCIIKPCGAKKKSSLLWSPDDGDHEEGKYEVVHPGKCPEIMKGDLVILKPKTTYSVLVEEEEVMIVDWNKDVLAIVG